MDDVLGRIPALLSARYPLLWLLSAEEERVERGLERVCEANQLQLYVWRSTTGLASPFGGHFEGTGPLAAALEEVSRFEAPALFVLEDPGERLADPSIQRQVRDLVRQLESRRQALAVLSYRLDIPVDLEKDFTVLDVPLPARNEVAKLLALLLTRQRIQVQQDLFDQFVAASLGLSEKEIKRAYARLLVEGKRFTRADVDLLVEEKARMLRKSRHLEFVHTHTDVGDVGGLGNLKEWLDHRRAAFGERAREFGLPEPKGLFLLGVQGCGKSLSAKAVATSWRVPLLRLDVAALFAGRAEEGLRDTIRIAESLAPVVLWIDEIEKAFLGDGGGGRVFGSFLTWMQEKSRPVFVVATANEVRALPPELLRKGRFDEIFFVDLPNAHERLEILEIHLRHRGRDPDSFDLLALAEETERWSGAEIEQLVVSAMFLAFAEGRELQQRDLVRTVRDSIPLAVTMDDRLKELREWARPRARPASVDTRRVALFQDWEGEG